MVEESCEFRLSGIWLRSESQECSVCEKSIDVERDRAEDIEVMR